MKPEGYEPTIFEAKAVKEQMIPMIIQISRSTLITAIKAAGIDLPGNCEITFHVPGGGDYSSCDVALDNKEQIITVRYDK